jgi:hypothetical protein
MIESLSAEVDPLHVRISFAAGSFLKPYVYQIAE